MGVKDKLDPLLGQPIGQLHIFRAPEIGIKAIGIEQMPSHQRGVAGVKLTCARFPVRGSRIRILLVEHRLFPAHPGLHIKIQRGQHGANHDHLFIKFSMGCHVLSNQLWHRHDIIVKEKDNLTRRELNSTIPRSGRSLISLYDNIQCQFRLMAQLLQILIRAIGRTIGNDNDFKFVGWVALPFQPN